MSGRSVVQMGGVAMSSSIVAAVLILGGTPKQQGMKTPDVPMAADARPPSVHGVPTPKPADADATSSSTFAPTADSTKSDVTPNSPRGKRPAKPVTPAASHVWSALGSYEKGDLVTHRGDSYRALQDYVGEGDPDWIYADSLWERV